MRTRLLVAAMAMIAGCRQNAPVQPVADPPANTIEAVEPAPASVAAPKPFVFDDTSDLLEFHYAWPAEAAASPALAERFTNAMNGWKAKLLAGAAKDKSFNEKNGYPFHVYSGSMDWTTAGETKRLLSLSGKLDDYTGGAHGNHGTKALLWDRQDGAKIGFTGLFQDERAPTTILHDRWCAALDAERAHKRGETASEGGEFNRCPPLGELAIVPLDSDGNGRFEQVKLIADPYVAGPYAEGNYEVLFPVGTDFIAALKPEYRASFEAQPQ